MGKSSNTNETTNDQAAANAPAEDVTLEEFCIRLSKSDKRVEMIGGFQHAETAAGHVKDTEAAYRSRYSDFCNKPV
jgi:hypothetical protein